MSLYTILETILIGPIKILFECIFYISQTFTEHVGLSIFFLSLIMNILVLPLYKRADAMQEEARNAEAKLHDGAAHIKKVFSGDEKMMILQTYYRQNHYKPTDTLKGSISLLLQIPFFMAAYQFLSNLADLKGASLGFISDLGTPDGLLVIGGVSINILPILMTLINLLSCEIYLKGVPLKNKLQLYGMAIFFLIILYPSPAGLVFYWTLNNIFSLGKTIYYRLKKKGIHGPQLSLKIHLFKTDTVPIPDKKRFLSGSIFLTVLIGLLIPSTLIASSPQEFVDVTYFYNPLWFVASSLCLAAGAFLVWMRVFYWLAKPGGKVLFDKLVWIFGVVMLMNYMFFGTKLGVISSALQYEQAMHFTAKEYIFNILAILAVSFLLYLCIKKWTKFITPVGLITTAALSAMSLYNVATIHSSVNSASEIETSDSPYFQLSTTGQNVVILMLDRAMGEYLPYFLKEKPELRKQLDGFTYYSNTVSFGGHTNFALPALVGGYEYTPVELNIRDTESLPEKHNEALKVMPVLFYENDYHVTVCDPSYANYSSIPDLSIFDKYPGMQTYITKGTFSDASQKQQTIEYNQRNFFCFSIMKSMPLFLQPIIYNDGNYNRSQTKKDLNYVTQTINSTSVAEGYDKDFMDSYNVLVHLNNMTEITTKDTNTFLFMVNETTHSNALLSEPDYTPAYSVDNTSYDTEHADRFTINETTLDMSAKRQITHYHANMAAILQIGHWLDYLRENDVYDNTRIIIAADHGAENLYHNDNFVLDDGNDIHKNAELYYPLLLVKDFNSTGFSISDEFMTNADVPTLATQNLIKNPTNPFTGKAINNNEKYAHAQYVILSGKYYVKENKGKTYLSSKWACVTDNIWNKNNWHILDEAIVLKEHKFP